MNVPIWIEPIKIKFTRASKKDKKLVTINVKSLVREYPVLRALNLLEKGDRFIIEICDGKCSVPLLFTINRMDKEFPATATTKTWPLGDLEYPFVGEPVECELVSLEMITEVCTIID